MLLHIALYAITGFCTTAGTIAVTHLLARVLRKPETYYSKRNSDG